MDSFYSTVTTVAFIILLIVLIMMGIAMHKQDTDAVFPIYASDCPDGWGMEEKGCKVPSADFQNYPMYPEMMEDPRYKGPGKIVQEEEPGVLSFNKNATICEKKTWANTVGVSWDGVTNYNKC